MKIFASKAAQRAIAQSVHRSKMEEDARPPQTLRASDLEKMRAYVSTGCFLSPQDALDLLAKVEQLRTALKDIQADSARHRVLEITREALA